MNRSDKVCKKLIKFPPFYFEKSSEDKFDSLINSFIETLQVIYLQFSKLKISTKNFLSMLSIVTKNKTQFKTNLIQRNQRLNFHLTNQYRPLKIIPYI